MNNYVRDLLDTYHNPESIPYTAIELAERIARGDNHHADYMWLLARAEAAEAMVTKVQNAYDAMVRYRHGNELNFQLEKFDDYLNAMGNAMKGGAE